MTRDLETLMHWLRISLWVAAFFANAFPLLYLFSRWTATSLGRVLMFQSVSLALALDITLLFQYWQPKDILVVFWIELAVFALIAFSTGWMTFLLWRTNYTTYNLRREDKKRVRINTAARGE